jgi:hypothetical protein
MAKLVEDPALIFKVRRRRHPRQEVDDELVQGHALCPGLMVQGLVE